MTGSFEVEQPILNSAFEEPAQYWFIQPGETPEQRSGRRPSFVFRPRDLTGEWDTSDGTLEALSEYEGAFALRLVNLVRERVKSWREQGYPGVTRTSLELLEWWRRDGREKRLFFAQLEAAETIIFLTEARADFRQGITVPREDPGDGKLAGGFIGFQRYACKMATGAGKTTVMGMLAAWSILNKVNARGNGRFSDVVLIVCPNVTIRDRLQELDPERGEASLYRTRDLVPSHLMPLLSRGRVMVTNWHVFEPQVEQQGGVSAKVIRSGVPVRTRETIRIGPRTTTARGRRYLTETELERQEKAGLLHVIERDNAKVVIESVRYVESDTALVARVLGREVGGKQNILVFNDEAHHAYRIRHPEPDEDETEALGEEEEAQEFVKEATIWVDGLDRIHKLRGINFCVDLSATPYFLGGVGRDTARPFPWVVSDFGLIDAIESGLVKIPQLAVRDNTGDEIPGYYNVWEWIMKQLSGGERGGRRGSPRPDAILKWANHPIAILGGQWAEETRRRASEGADPRPPVFILVCKNTQIAKVIYEWLAEDKCPSGIPKVSVAGFRNRDGEMNTIRVDSKVVHESDTDSARSDETRWMRFTLDTIGKTGWTTDSQGRPIYPVGFEELARKVERPLHPPGRDVRCIVSVGMLTEGWDANTVTHIVGLRPFMSQLLCEQVVGRGLRRVSYDFDDEGKFREEVATVFGVPFDIIPFKATSRDKPVEPVKRYHVHALPAKAEYEIRFPRVEGYTQAIHNRVAVEWERVPGLDLDPLHIPTEVQMKGLNVDTRGRPSLTGPGRVSEASLHAYRIGKRLQALVFELAGDLTRRYLHGGQSDLPAHVLFPQLVKVVERYVRDKVRVHAGADIKDLFLSPYYGWALERIAEAIRPDTSQGEAPEVPRYETTRGDGSTADVSFWTSRDVRAVERSHVNYVVADTARWEQSAAYYIDTHPRVRAFVKNAGLGFTIPYLYDGRMHDYVPDFLVKLDGEDDVTLILETKGYDPRAEIKAEAAERWVRAVNADGRSGWWEYALVRAPGEVRGVIERVVEHSDEHRVTGADIR